MDKERVVELLKSGEGCISSACKECYDVDYCFSSKEKLATAMQLVGDFKGRMLITHAKVVVDSEGTYIQIERTPAVMFWKNPPDREGYFSSYHRYKFSIERLIKLLHHAKDIYTRGYRGYYILKGELLIHYRYEWDER